MGVVFNFFCVCLLKITLVLGACPPFETAPPNGRIECPTTPRECQLVCDHGYILSSGPDDASSTCNTDDDDDVEQWSVDLTSSSQCVRPVGLIVGGTNVRREYEASVEIVAGVEQSSLNGRRLADLPVKVGTKVNGASGGFVDGKILVCGGVVEGPSDCIREEGGSEWCTGPKSKACFIYNPLLDSWSEASFGLTIPRAFASYNVLDNGKTFLLTGGATNGAILDSSENYDRTRNQKFVERAKLPVKVYAHCAMDMGQGEIIVAGGFADGRYSNSAHTSILVSDGDNGLKRRTDWETHDWSQLITHRSEHSCIKTVINDTAMINLSGLDIKSNVCRLINQSLCLQLLVAGGRNEEGSLSSVEVFDLANEKWAEIGQASSDDSDNVSLPDFRNSAGASLLLIDGKPTLAGGVACPLPSESDESSSQVGRCQRTDSILQYDAETDSWSEIGRLRVGRASQAVFPVPHTLF